jgi:hypothetical protein
LIREEICTANRNRLPDLAARLQGWSVFFLFLFELYLAGGWKMALCRKIYLWRKTFLLFGLRKECGSERRLGRLTGSSTDGPGWGFGREGGKGTVSERRRYSAAYFADA